MAGAFRTHTAAPVVAGVGSGEGVGSGVAVVSAVGTGAAVGSAAGDAVPQAERRSIRAPSKRAMILFILVSPYPL